MKLCTKCKLEKDFSEFNKGNVNGKHAYCKICQKEISRKWQQENRDRCNQNQRNQRLKLKQTNPDKWRIKIDRENENRKQYRKTVSGKVGSMWSGILNRVKNKYTSIHVNFTREEFVNWATPKVKVFFEKYPEETPSVDRINPLGDYSFDNIRIISLTQNLIRSSMISKKINVNKNMDKNLIYERLSMTVFSVCKYTETSIEEFQKYLQEVANEDLFWNKEEL